MRGVIDKKGEQFAYLEGNVLYTMDGEPSGQIQGDFIVDLAGNKIWRVVGHGIYTLNSGESIGYIGSSMSKRFAW